jgi:hypothetical protein
MLAFVVGKADGSSSRSFSGAGGILKSLLRADPQFFALAGVFALGLALRIANALPFTLEHPDEIWQYLEPAYHLTKGPWVQTWEYREGLRSWLPPVLVAGPMWIGQWWAPGTTLYLLLPRLFFASISMLIVVASVCIGGKQSRTHALIAGLVAAVWFEFVYMAPKILMDSISTAIFMAGAAALFSPSGQHSKHADIISGALLGLSLVLRIQNFPAIAVLVVLTLGYREPRRYGYLVLGALAPLALDATINLFMGAVPFAWVSNSLMQNVVHGKSTEFGVYPAYQYAEIFNNWGLWSAAIFAVAFPGARRYPALAAAALVHITVFSFVPHKEWRFTFLTIAILFLFAAIGTADLVQFLKERMRPYGIAAAIIFWISGSTVLYLQQHHPFRPNYELERPLRFAGKVDASCAIALYKIGFGLSGAHVLTDNAAPFYNFQDLPDPRSVLIANQQAFGAIVTQSPFLRELPSAFDQRACFATATNPDSHMCVAKRQAKCTATGPASIEMNRWLASHGR